MRKWIVVVIGLAVVVVVYEAWTGHMRWHGA
jgi:hypothetical protein